MDAVGRGMAGCEAGFQRNTPSRTPTIPRLGAVVFWEPDASAREIRVFSASLAYASGSHFPRKSNIAQLQNSRAAAFTTL